MKIIGAMLALCVAIAVQAKDPAKVIGSWYDDLGSPKFGDATLVIEQAADSRYFLVRRNGDGSGGRFLLERRGAEFIKVGDRFGAKYVIKGDNLDLHDKQGFIRSAKPKAKRQ